MHLTTAPILHRVLTFGKSQEFTNRVGAIITVAWIIGFIIHATMDEFLLHGVSFFISVCVIAYQTNHLITEQVTNPVYQGKVRGIARFGFRKCANINFPKISLRVLSV